MKDITAIAQCLGNTRKKAPLVHCITNFVTVNDCANVVLAAGGSPTMSRMPAEVAEITAGCSSLVLNMGTVSDTEAMLIAGKKANELGHPVILDPVGAGASKLRRDTAAALLGGIQLSLIRGNASEIKYLATGSGPQAGGVDAALSDRIDMENACNWARLALGLSERTGAVVAVSGAVDVLAGKGRAFMFTGGCAEMSRITGSGCMLTALMGTYLGANPESPLEAAVCAQAEMNAAGELAIAKTRAAGGGTMTFRMHLIDEISLMDEETWHGHARFDELSLRAL